MEIIRLGKTEWQRFHARPTQSRNRSTEISLRRITLLATEILLVGGANQPLLVHSTSECFTRTGLLDFAAMDTRLIPINLLGIATTLSAYAQNTDAELLFVRRIVPLLHEKCLACHGHDEAMVK